MRRVCSICSFVFCLALMDVTIDTAVGDSPLDSELRAPETAGFLSSSDPFSANEETPLGSGVALMSAVEEPGSLRMVCEPEHWTDNLTFFAGIDGSKQPQDYGVNANLGGQVNFNLGLPISRRYGIGVQAGVGLISTTNAVQVYELLGERTERTQAYTTLGIFQRTSFGWSWGIAYDLLQESSFDDFTLGQWRGRIAYDLNCQNQLGFTAQIASKDERGFFNNVNAVVLSPIDQGSVYWRHLWESGTQTTCWLGLAEGHGENNAVTGNAPDTGSQFVFGADFLAPLNDQWALYGETNIMFPADTGTVDAFLGFMWFPGGGAFSARRTPFAPLLPVAAPTSFSVDLRR